MNKGEYLENIVNLRGLAILLVVIGHAFTPFVSNYAGHSYIEFLPGKIFRYIIYSFHMPLFMGISGYLFYFEILKCKKPKKAWGGVFSNILGFVKKKIKRLLIPFLIAMYCWRKPLLVLADLEKYRNMTNMEILKDYVSIGTTGSLWFLYTLFIIFIVQRLLVNFVWKSERTIFIWAFLFLIGNITGNNFSGPIHHILIHNFYFFMGCLAHKYINEIRNSRKWSIPVVVVISIILTSISFLNAEGIVAVVSAPAIALSLLTIVIALCNELCIFQLSYLSLGSFSKPIHLISDLSMGIYIFHEPLIIVLGNYLKAIQGIVIIPIFIIFSLFTSMLVSWFLRKIQFQFVLGE